jgi:glutathione S-transferase
MACIAPPSVEDVKATRRLSARLPVWLIGERLTIADFSIGAFVPSATRFGLPLARFSEIGRWYEGLAALPAWQDAVAAKDAATAAWLTKGKA